MTLIDVLSKYPQNNNEWELHNYNFSNGTSLGKRISWIYNEMMVNCGIDTIPNDVINSINKLDTVTQYFVRRSLCNLHFIGDDSFNRLEPYNSDPWGREFLLYVHNVTHHQFAYIKNRDGWDKRYISLYFSDRVSVVNNHLQAPLMVLYVTSVEGREIYCLDMIK